MTERVRCSCNGKPVDDLDWVVAVEIHKPETAACPVCGRIIRMRYDGRTGTFIGMPHHYTRPRNTAERREMWRTNFRRYYDRHVRQNGTD